MSRMGFWCKECGCFRENIEDNVDRHVLAAKEILCAEGEDPFASGLCSGFATFKEVKRRKKRARYQKASGY
jgi:hypothetical protein